MNISGLNKAAVLAALYNRATTGGMGFLQYDPKPMTVEQAQKILDQGITRFDYLKGRAMKIRLEGDEINTEWYDHPDYNGPNAAEEAIEALRKSGDPNARSIKVAHDASTMRAVSETEMAMKEPAPPPTTVGGVTAFSVGLDDVKEHLRPVIDRIKKDNRN